MTRDDYLEWVQTQTAIIAQHKYPDNKQLQIIHQMGLVQRALADLCYIDSQNTSRVNAMLKRNIAGPSQAFKPKQR